MVCRPSGQRVGTGPQSFPLRAQLCALWLVRRCPLPGLICRVDTFLETFPLVEGGRDTFRRTFYEPVLMCVISGRLVALRKVLGS